MKTDPCAAQRIWPLPRWPYEIRPLRTDAELAAAAALVEDRARWMADRGIPLPPHVAAAFRDTSADAVGLYEYAGDDEEELAGCLLLHRPLTTQATGEAATRSLGISLVHTAPGRTLKVGWLITLWAADFAERIGARRVHAEALSRHAGSDPTRDPLLEYLCSLGWQVTGSGHPAEGGGRVTRLRLTAQEWEALKAALHCSVPLQVSTNPAPMGATSPCNRPL
ncbi:hypothetical protein GCM10010289_69250 [Streptomyces violascens]|nr:hypothetical protein GCM10010289_69250 [Streptomyces violascens]